MKLKALLNRLLKHQNWSARRGDMIYEFCSPCLRIKWQNIPLCNVDPGYSQNLPLSNSHWGSTIPIFERVGPVVGAARSILITSIIIIASFFPPHHHHDYFFYRVRNFWCCGNPPWFFHMCILSFFKGWMGDKDYEHHTHTTFFDDKIQDDTH